MLFQNSVPWITLFVMVGVWDLVAIPGVSCICPQHCLKNLPLEDKCPIGEASVIVHSAKLKDIGSDYETSNERGQQEKKTGGLDDHGNCREVDQGSLTYQFKLTDTGEKCTKCSCEYGQPPGSDPSCEYEPHNECIKLGLNPILRPSNNNRVHPSEYEKPDEGSPDYSYPEQPERLPSPDYSDPVHPERLPSPDYSDPVQPGGQDPENTDFIKDYSQESGQSPSNSDDPDFTESLKFLKRPSSRFPTKKGSKRKQQQQLKLATSHRFGARPRPPGGRSPLIATQWNHNHKRSK